MEIQKENSKICPKCGGRCCKKSGCDYLPNDFQDMSTNALVAKLLEGHISIVSTLKIGTDKNNNIEILPILSLRERNVNRPIVDLLSLKKRCSALKEDGCMYDYQHRPTGGKNLIPQENGKCYDLNANYKIEAWLSYQKILQRVVKKITGKSVSECLKEDVKNLFLDYLFENFDGVSEMELEEIKGLFPYLEECYKEELKLATETYNQSLQRKRCLKHV